MTQEEFLQELNAFISEWHNDEPTIWVHTSGSTGKPKPMQVEKKRMEASALLTCSFLDLKEGDTALLCMPLQYIAGKMMVVRSLVKGLNLISIAPCGHPLAEVEEVPVFAAMIPIQVYNSMQVKAEREKLKAIKHLIIGGGAVDKKLADELKHFPNNVWSTYGMTETLSHIALRRLSGDEASDWYSPFDDVSLSLTDEGTLSVYAPRVCSERLVTHDIAEIRADGKFRIIGRSSNTIHSGGVKIQIEKVEELLNDVLDVPYQITAAPDEKFGEKMVMLYEDGDEEELKSICRKVLPVYWIPRLFIRVDNLPFTETGKPDRAKARKLATKTC